MSSVSWVFRVSLREGRVEDLKDLVQEMSAANKAGEPETLAFEWTISEDQKTAEVRERYANSEAALRHLASFNQNFADRLMALVEPAGMTVYGNPSPALKKELAGSEPVYMHGIGGFARQVAVKR
jgi:quinol monooxygenase YgiN